MAVSLYSKALHANRVAGTVSLGAMSLPYDVPKWGVDLTTGGTLTVTLDVDTGTPGRNCAPHRVIIEANVTGFAGEDLTTADWDASVHRVEYVHDSGDIYAGDWAFPDRLLIKSRRVFHAKRSVHVYREPGKYVHSVFAYDHEGNWGTASTEIEVVNHTYSPDRVVVLAQDGDFTNAPYCTPTNKVTTLAAADARLRAVAGTAPKVFYVKRGATYTPTETLFTGDWDVFPWGKGANPKWVVNPGVRYAFNAIGGGYCKVQDMDVEGPWDATGSKYQTGVLADYMDGWYAGGLLASTALSGSVDLVVDRCNATGTTANMLNPSALAGSAVLHECSSTNFKEFLVFGYVVQGTLAALGCDLHQHLQADNGGLPRWFFNDENDTGAGFYPNNAHHGFRTGGTKNVVIYGNDWFGRHGWTLQTQDTWANNPLVRLNTDGGGDGNRSWVVNNWFEGSVITGNAGSGNGGMMNAMNSVWEFNQITRDPTSGCISVQGKGNTIRNNIFRIPNTPNPHHSLSSVVNMGDDPADPNVGRNEAYNNTIIDLLPSDKHSSTFAQYRTNGRPGSLVENNLYYAPNLTVPDIADGPLDLTLLPHVPRYLGSRKAFEWWKDHYTLPAEVPINGSFVMPYRADRNGTMTNAASFAGHFGKHKIGITGGNALENLSAVTGAIIVAFEAGGIRITNKTAGAWSSGGVVSAWLDRGSTGMAMDTTRAAPADTHKRGWVTAEAGAYQAATAGLVSVHDWRGRPRRGSEHPNAPAGAAPSRGATEPTLAI